MIAEEARMESRKKVLSAVQQAGTLEGVLLSMEKGMSNPDYRWSEFKAHRAQAEVLLKRMAVTISKI